MFYDLFLLANGELSVNPLNGVPKAVFFGYKRKWYWVFLGELKDRLSYDEAMQVAQETKLCGVSCSLMPASDLLGLFSDIKGLNAMKKRFGLREIPTSIARFWAESKDGNHSYVVINEGHVGLRFRNGGLHCAYALPVLACDKGRCLSRLL